VDLPVLLDAQAGNDSRIPDISKRIPQLEPAMFGIMCAGLLSLRICNRQDAVTELLRKELAAK
jgi:hypothetical protein